MKQRITVDQLKELTLDQQVNLRKWWEPQIHDVIVLYGMEQSITSINGNVLWGNGCSEFKSRCLPLLSIGQCIELLQSVDEAISVERKTHVEYSPQQMNLPHHVLSWGIRLRYTGKDAINYELIDALWEVVKVVLTT